MRAPRAINRLISLRPVRVLLLLALASGAVSVTAAGCSLPAAPSKIPDGATATDGEMQAIMTTMLTYESDVSNYLKCIAFEAKQSRLSQEDLARLTADALERHQAAVTRFNAQMRLYMAR